MRILGIMMDRAHLQLVAILLKQEQVIFEEAVDTEEGLDMVRSYNYDIILYSHTPAADRDIIPSIRALRALRPRTGILVLDGFPDLTVGRCVGCLRAGGDDYLPSPVSVIELVARLRAVHRRYCGHAVDAVEVGGFTVHMDAQTVTHRDTGNLVHLTRHEYLLFSRLLIGRGQTMSKLQLLEGMYGGQDTPEVKIVDVYLCRLRDKLSKYEAAPLIETVWGRGYRIESEVPLLKPYENPKRLSRVPA